MNRNVVAIDTETTQSDWQTPPEIHEKLSDDFGPFHLDLTANEENALIRPWFGPGSSIGTDALEAEWTKYGLSGYCNPPYGKFIPHILRKAVKEREKGFTSCFLLPMRVTRWFKNLVLPGASAAFFCDKRITFYEDGAPRLDIKGKPMPAMFDSLVVLFEPGHRGQGRFGLWRVPDHV